MKTDSELLQAALIGYQSELTRIQQAMAEIRRRLEPSTGVAAEPAARGKRKMSAAARKKIAAAQKKRWAEHNRTKEAPAKEPPAKKRRLSAAGRKRIAEATKKRWAAVRAQKAAAQKVAARKSAVKKVKRTKKRTGSTSAPAVAKVESPATS